MIRDEFYLMVHGVSIIGWTYNAYAGSIESRQGMHHNLVHLWKRAICCCRGQSDALWIKFAFVNHTAPPKNHWSMQKWSRKTSKPRPELIYRCAVVAFPAKLLLTAHDYRIRVMQERRGWSICVYSNKQCQCSRLWQTLHWIAIVINNSALRHFFLNEVGGNKYEVLPGSTSISKRYEWTRLHPDNNCCLTALREEY